MSDSEIIVPKLPVSRFNLTKKRVGSMQAGLIYPVWSMIAQPGDKTKVKIQTVARRLATISPSFAEDKVIFRAHKVPLRILDENFPQWLTGIKKYSDNIPYEEDVPRWIPSNISKTRPGTLWQMLGYPTNTLPTLCPANYKQQAYGFIYDTNYRYRPVEDSILEEGKPGTWKGEDLLRVYRDADYFTIGLTEQQAGEPVALPLTGETSAVFDLDQNYMSGKGHEIGTVRTTSQAIQGGQAAVIGAGNTLTGQITGGVPGAVTGTTAGYTIKRRDGKPITESEALVVAGNKGNLEHILNNNIVSMKNIASATINMIRLAGAKQNQGEMLCRTGAYYPDVIRINWGTAPSDEVLGLPIYLGGFQLNMINSEVLQTAPSNDLTPLGDMAGHGLGLGNSDEIEFTANEHSVFMLLCYIKSDNFYGAQQLKKEDMFISKEDMSYIAFQHVAEQPQKKQEICCISKKKPMIDTDTGQVSWGEVDPTAEAYNNDVYAFLPNYEHMRRDYNDVFGLMTMEQFYDKKNPNNIITKTNLSYWTQARFFSIKDGERPSFNKQLLQYYDDMRNYAVQYKDIDGKINEDQYIVWFKFIVDAVRVLDEYGTPGLFDHMGVI